MRPILVLLAMSLCLPSVAGFGAPRVGEVGDAWEERVWIGSGDEARSSTSRTLVAAAERIVVNDTSHDALRIETWENVTSEVDGNAFVDQVRTTTWIRASDGAFLRAVAVVKQRLASEDEFLGEHETETIALEPCVSGALAFDVGDAWTTTCTLRSTHESAGGPPTPTTKRQTSEWSVLRRERVTVAAGAFDTLVVESVTTDGEEVTRQLTWTIVDGCADAKTELRDEEGALLRSAELLASACAKDAPPEPTPASPTSAPTPASATPSPTPSPVASPPATTPTSAGPSPTPPTYGTPVGLPGPGPALVLALVGAAAIIIARRR